LDDDLVFRNDLLRLININNQNHYNISTQNISDYGIPDIELTNDETCIIIECKIESTERDQQLSDYVKILKTRKNKEKHLIYLTKYYELKEINDDKILFNQIRWCDIFEIIHDDHNQITKQLKLFIKENNMEKAKNFNYSDILVLNNIQETISKMDEVLDTVKPYFTKHIGTLSKDSSRSTRLSEKWYANFFCVSLEQKFQFDIGVGFYWWDDIINVAIRISVPKNSKTNNSKKNYIEFFNDNLNWEIESDENHTAFWYYKSVPEFIIEESEQIPKIIEFIEEGIDKLIALKKIDKNIFGK
jgi:hypothetical protein